MKIAVTYEDGKVFQHFGHTKTFKLYTVENDVVIETSMLDASHSGHGALAKILQEAQVETLICGGIGGGAQHALANAGIRLYGGVSGHADEAVENFLAGKLNFNPNVKCNHHGEHHENHDKGHKCGHHGGHHESHDNGHKCGHHGKHHESHDNGHKCGHSRA